MAFPGIQIIKHGVFHADYVHDKQVIAILVRLQRL